MPDVSPPPRFLTPLEGLRIGLSHTLVLTGNCLWEQGLGAYLLLSVFISLCADPTSQALLSWEDCYPTSSEAEEETGKTLLAAGGGR